MHSGLVRLTNPVAIRLIREFQESEGNLPCFQGGKCFCSQEDCCWREICLDEFHPKASHIFEVIK